MAMDPSLILAIFSGSGGRPECGEGGGVQQQGAALVRGHLGDGEPAEVQREHRHHPRLLRRARPQLRPAAALGQNLVHLLRHLSWARTSGK